mgnify:CR=1 FL=1
MDDNTKIELAREVMNAFIARACKNGFDKNNKLITTLLKEEKEMNNFNFKVIDKIINKYAPIIKRGEI